MTRKMKNSISARYFVELEALLRELKKLGSIIYGEPIIIQTHVILLKKIKDVQVTAWT